MVAKIWPVRDTRSALIGSFRDTVVVVCTRLDCSSRVSLSVSSALSTDSTNGVDGVKGVCGVAGKLSSLLYGDRNPELERLRVGCRKSSSESTIVDGCAWLLLVV